MHALAHTLILKDTTNGERWKKNFFIGCLMTIWIYVHRLKHPDVERLCDRCSFRQDDDAFWRSDSFSFQDGTFRDAHCWQTNIQITFELGT